jgi:hypothetical protein
MDTIIKTKNTGETHQYETRMATHIPGETIKRVGRPPCEIIYEPVIIDDIEYVCGTLYHNGDPLKFILDKEDETKVKSRHWYAITGGKYVGVHITINNSKKILYLHNFIMNRFDFPGKGAKESVDHINRNGLDNRKCNLRIITQAIQNTNQKKRERYAELPDGITDLPKHIWYVKANGHHGDRFCIELKTEKIRWKTTSSKKVSIQDKLEQAKAKLEELYKDYPYLNKT